MVRLVIAAMPKIKYNVSKLIMWGWQGKVFYPYVLFAQSKEDVTDELFRHELEHVYQVQRMGWWKFYISYLWLAIRHGYDLHPYEVEAVSHQTEPLTTVERYWKEM